MSTPRPHGDVIPFTPRPSGMTFAEAKQVLASIGYRQDMTLDEIIAATPDDMMLNVDTALTVAAEAYAAEAAEIRAVIQGSSPDVR